MIYLGINLLIDYFSLITTKENKHIHTVYSIVHLIVIHSVCWSTGRP
jgi:hypothetical protein